jgi:hypothetical protein
MWCTTGVKIGGGGESKHHDGDEGKDSESKAPDSEEQEAPQRTVEVKIVSGTHGHLVSILKVQVCPRPFVLNRTLRFQVIKLPILPVIRVTPATYASAYKHGRNHVGLPPFIWCFCCCNMWLL